MMFWYGKECEYYYQMEEMMIANRCCSREYRQIQDNWRDVQWEYEETKSKVLALEKELEQQKAQELADISVDETLHFEENEVE